MVSVVRVTVRSRCGVGFTVDVGEPLPEHGGRQESMEAEATVGFDPAWPPCLCHPLGRRLPTQRRELRAEPVVLVSKRMEGPGHVEYGHEKSGVGSRGFPCSWSRAAVVSALRKIGVNAALDNGRVPAGWSHAAIGAGSLHQSGHIDKVLGELRKAGVAPRREASLEAFW